LHGRQKIVEILLQEADGARSGHAGGQQLLNARVADGDQRELSSHKKGVGQNEHGHSDKLQRKQTVHLACEDSISAIWNPKTVTRTMSRSVYL
jgi:hypothetical protein